ncbi:MAG: MoaD/ThiS family protein [Candidatus Aenigmatarchaeota archaeon]
MKIVFFHTKKEIEIRGGRKVRDILKELQLSPEAWLVSKDGELITMDEWIEDGETVLLIPVVSGGSL